MNSNQPRVGGYEAMSKEWTAKTLPQHSDPGAIVNFQIMLLLFSKGASRNLIVH